MDKELFERPESTQNRMIKLNHQSMYEVQLELHSSDNIGLPAKKENIREIIAT